jgi:hypothetical protein
MKRVDSEHRLLQLEEKLVIDPDDLDHELVVHSNDFYHACQGYDLALSRRDQAKEEIANHEAALSLEIRRSYATRKERITEDHIKALIQVDNNHTSLVKEYLELKYLADRWKSLRDSFDKKGGALDNLNKRDLKMYFGETAIPATDRKDAIRRINKDAHVLLSEDAKT